MKKRSLLLLVLTVFCSAVSTATPVKGYYRKDGTYVAPHQRSSPNATKADNYSTKGNVNPYTRKSGAKSEGVTTGTTDVTPVVASGQPTQPTTSPAQFSVASTPRSPQSNEPATVMAPTPKPALADLSKIKVGMTKAQVVSAVGEPNVKSEASWLYADRGWVRFKADAVRQIEVR